MSGTIVVLVNEGDQDSQHVDQAIDLAAEKEATVHGIYVIDAWRFGEYSVYGWDELAREIHEETSEDLLTVIEKKCEERGVDFEPVTTRGKPLEKVLSYAGTNDVDLIVCGHPEGTGAQMRSVNMIEHLQEESPAPVEIV